MKKARTRKKDYGYIWSSLAGFAFFWQLYPRQVGRLAAEKAYAKALTHATHDDICTGVSRYLADLAQDQTPLRFICHPATWLNQGRWMDEIRQDERRSLPWRVECQWLGHQPRCTTQWAHGRRVQRDDAAAVTGEGEPPDASGRRD